MNRVHEQRQKIRLSKNNESNRAKNRLNAPCAQPLASPAARPAVRPALRPCACRALPHARYRLPRAPAHAQRPHARAASVPACACPPARPACCRAPACTPCAHPVRPAARSACLAALSLVTIHPGVLQHNSS